MGMWSVFKHNYDRENDILYLYDECVRPKGSLIFGEGQIVLDYGASDALASVEILDASKYLKAAFGSGAPSPSKLAKIVKARVDVRHQNNILFLNLAFTMPEPAEPVRLNIQVPQAARLTT